MSSGEGLDRGGGIHVRDRDRDACNTGRLKIAPALLDLIDGRHVGHGAAGSEVGEDHCLAVVGQDVGALGHEVHAAEHDELCFRVRGSLLGELEGIACHIGEGDDLIALVMVTEDVHPIAEGGLGALGALHEIGV